jgi:hypothetical protein
MRTGIRRTFGVLCAALTLAGVGLVAPAVPASAHQGCPDAPTSFDINGDYSVGGPARPRICTRYNLLTVDLSAFGRPTANGVVHNRYTISVTFPDDTTHYAHLDYQTRTINWLNGTVWTQVTARPVPHLQGLDVERARSVLNAAGFILGSQRTIRICGYDGVIYSQTPAGGALANPGTLVNVTVGEDPPDCGEDT